MTMYKPYTCMILFLTGLLFLQGCGLTSRIPVPADERLQTTMQQPGIESNVAKQQQALPVKLGYEIMHKPLPGQELLITLDIKPTKDLFACAYSVKAPEAIEIVEPLGIINLGRVRAGKMYQEQVRVRPVDEGLYEVKIFLTTEGTGNEQQFRTLRIPLSIGPFQESGKSLR